MPNSPKQNNFSPLGVLEAANKPAAATTREENATEGADASDKSPSSLSKKMKRKLHKEEMKQAKQEKQRQEELEFDRALKREIEAEQERREEEELRPLTKAEKA